MALGTAALIAGSSAGVPRSFYGVVSQTPLTTEDVDRMGEGEVGTLRMLFDWATIDPTRAQGDYDWGAIDPVVADAIRNGIQPLPFFIGSPAWVAEGLDHRRCAPPICGLYAPESPAALREWERFVAAAATRYGPGGDFFAEHPELPEAPITTWQIWNEQNSKSFYEPRPDVASYAALVGSASAAIKGIDPKARILLGGMFGTPYGGDPPSLAAWRFLDALYDTPGAAGDFDGVGVHPYAARLPGVIEQVELMRGEIVEAGDTDTGLWITEIAWSSGAGANPLERGEAGQAERLRQAMNYFLSVRDAYRIENVTWFAWRDLVGQPICAWCGQAGLFEAEELVAKPAWGAFAGYTGGR